MRPADRPFYLTWIAANACAEAVGLGTTMVIGWGVAARIERLDGVAATLATALVAIVLGTLLEGVVVGALQEFVLHKRIAQLPWRSWTIATAVGAAIAWALGMIPSTAMALITVAEPASQAPAEPTALAQLLLAAGLGFVAGPILGIAQWTVLRRVVAHAGRWLWANALAWAIGMPLIFLGMDHVPWSGHPLVVIGCIYVICGAAGVAVGAIHGRTLVRLLERIDALRRAA